MALSLLYILFIPNFYSFLDSRVFRKQPLYYHKIGVTFMFISPSPELTYGIVLHRNLNQHSKGVNEASTSREIRADESQEREGSAEKDATTFKFCVRTEHPCNFFGLAKQAFLKCLGFDSDRDNCNTRRHAKEE
ncbi:hypothetical protein AABB24_028333 [Solanum stoloniferum]|uniref:Uncharacterized protein n=1 Tax=Solanum stoloniferum TaxID=62892 RepID=A0ABD2S642_9SOLN